MNFDFSDEEKMLKEQARRVIAELAGAPAVRRVMAGPALYERPLWSEMARLGWLGAAIPEEYGGAGLGYVALCAIAEELGRGLAPVPTSSSIYLAAEALLLAGSEEQRRRYLPPLANGSCIAAFAVVEGLGALCAANVRARVLDGKLTTSKLLRDGLAADIAVVVARDRGDLVGLYLADLRAAGVTREALPSIDPSRPWARVRFAAVPVEALAGTATGWSTIQQLLERAAVMTSFEQLGAADHCLELARDYALQSEAFGRVIGQYQAVKHRLADVYVANELARSNAYYAAWALATRSPELPMAAAVARIAATDAFDRAARDNTQTHGGIAATWAHDAHLYYRRARQLALQLGPAAQWRDRLIDVVVAQQTAA